MPVLCIHEILTFSHVAQLWQLSIPCNGTGRDLEVLISCTILNDILVSEIFWCLYWHHRPLKVRIIRERRRSLRILLISVLRVT